MNQRYDFLAVSFLLFAAVFAAWLTAGPMNFSLKDWQPLMAALIALGAATLAYRGAMAKVELDQENSRRELTSKKLGLFLRVLLRLEVLRFEVERSMTNINEFNKTSKRTLLERKDLELSDVAELNEAWEKLDLLPGRTIDEINRIRDVLPKLRKALDQEMDKCGGTISKQTDNNAYRFLGDHKMGCEYTRELVLSAHGALFIEIERLGGRDYGNRSWRAWSRERDSRDES